MKQESSIRKFTDLVSWQKAHMLVVAIYKATQNFPKDEQFGLTSQMRRAAVSVSSNIAEGFSRTSYADKRHFYVMSHGSLTEPQNQSLVARDVEYLPTDAFNMLASQAVEAHKLITGLIKSTSAHEGA